MSMDSLGYEIRQAAAPDGSIALELVVEGATVARAQASQAVVDDLSNLLGLTRGYLTTELRRSLVEVLKTQGQFVEIADVVEDSRRALRFMGRFTYRMRDMVTTGLIWYDVDTAETGPDDVPAVARNMMRSEIHRRLTNAGSVARSLVDLHIGR